jgi:glucose-6-phosphate isomerase
LSNVDPVDVKRATDKLNPEETMAIVVSKTFTTRETNINAKTIKDWLIYHLVRHWYENIAYFGEVFDLGRLTRNDKETYGCLFYEPRYGSEVWY